MRVDWLFGSLPLRKAGVAIGAAAALIAFNAAPLGAGTVNTEDSRVIVAGTGSPEASHR
jgi:hypothetical protein